MPARAEWTCWSGPGRRTLTLPMLVAAAAVACTGASSGPAPGAELEAPTGLTASPADTRVALAWIPAPGEGIEYQVAYRTAGGDWVELGWTSGTTAEVSLLANGTPYEFRVAARAGAQRSAWSGAITATPGAPEPSLKPPVRGLVWNQTFLPEPPWDFVRSVVLRIGWEDLEPGDQRFDEGRGWATIDEALAAGYEVRLRVMAGLQAPAFVKRGPPETPYPGVSATGVVSNVDGRTYSFTCEVGIAFYEGWDHRGGCLPYFWLDYPQQQYRELMEEIARRYEADDRLREVDSSMCMTLYSEPFFRAHREAATNLRLLDAGLTAENDLACHRRSLEIHRDVLPRTRVTLAINRWDALERGVPDHVTTRWDEVEQLLDWAQRDDQLGDRLVLQTSSLDTAKTCPGAPHYCYLRDDARNPGFQLETFYRETDDFELARQDMYDAIQHGLDYGATFVEFSGMTRDIFSDLAAVGGHTALRGYDEALRR